MKTASNKIIVNLQVGSDFIEEIKREMLDELAISSRKWGIRLNTEDSDLIVNHSMNQLRKKIAESIKTNWDFGEKISIKVNAPGKTGDINLPDKSFNKSQLKLMKAREGWEFEQEPSEDSVLIKDFLEFFKNQIKIWARTAVFYGVASYAQ